MPVCVNGDLNRAVSHLLFHVGDRGTVLDKQATKGMAQIVKAETAQTRVLVNAENPT